ncbi:cupin domain-containing protein [Morganella psychrotolerans]|uniref:Cupin domain-containing protein n=1 Tax=Morganella psychrotolerans TaxID=368603 RepID=A0A5M9R8Y4_9GAMM|nr:cupin domain-containing protein [Morganella psychrotolerans]KAA8717200.1 cupin domain-containing protein [Morganella psychrotolerans]
MYQPINLKNKLSLVTEQWQPKVIAEMNDYQFKVVKIQGDFIWHTHPETDEAFIVLDGVLRIDFQDEHVQLVAGEMYVVPRGIEHKTSADIETHIMIIEPCGILNTGHEGGERTAKSDIRI